MARFGVGSWRLLNLGDRVFFGVLMFRCCVDLGVQQCGMVLDYWDCHRVWGVVAYRVGGVVVGCLVGFRPFRVWMF